VTRIRDRSPSPDEPFEAHEPFQPNEPFEALYEATSRRVYAYVRRRANAETAELVVSDTFLVAWRHWGRVPDPALPWLLRTAQNALRTHQRAARRRGRLTGALIFDTSLSVQPSAETQAVDRQHTLAALRRLPEVDREALLLVAWDGLDYAQAATVLGVSRSAFATRLVRARRRLDALLADHDHRPDATFKEIPA
jgi:RNA polymerase sigma-70 factor (ECF subfamily)